MGPILHKRFVGSVSVKIKNIINNIKSSEGIVFIYSDYIWSGGVPLAIALEHIGFSKFNLSNDFPVFSLIITIILIILFK